MIPQDELARRLLKAANDPRTVITDPNALYFGAHLNESSLVPGPGARIATTRFDDSPGSIHSLIRPRRA